MKYSIQHATIDNLEAIASLFNDYRIFYSQTSDIQAATKFIKQHLTAGTSTIFIAVSEQGETVGFTQLYPSFTSVGMKPIMILNDLYVSASARKTGVATGLIKAAKEYGQSKGCIRLALETEQTNTPAQDLYEQLGWKKEEGMFHYTIDL